VLANNSQGTVSFDSGAHSKSWDYEDLLNNNRTSIGLSFATLPDNRMDVFCFLLDSLAAERSEHNPMFPDWPQALIGLQALYVYCPRQSLSIPCPNRCHTRAYLGLRIAQGWDPLTGPGRLAPRPSSALGPALRFISRVLSVPSIRTIVTIGTL